MTSSQFELPARLLVIGQVLGPWGTDGQVKIQILTDFPQRFKVLREVSVQGKRMAVERARLYRGIVVLKLAEVEDRQSADALRGQLVEIDEKEAYPLPEGHYYWHQVIGLEVWTTQGVLVGTIKEILRTGSNDVYVVRQGSPDFIGSSKEILIPAIEEVVRSVDLQSGKMVIELIEGIL